MEGFYVLFMDINGSMQALHEVGHGCFAGLVEQNGVALKFVGFFLRCIGIILQAVSLPLKLHMQLFHLA